MSHDSQSNIPPCVTSFDSRYYIGGAIGQGSTGTVFEAVSQIDKRTFAIKRFFRAADPERIDSEIRAASLDSTFQSCSHVLRTIEFLLDPGDRNFRPGKAVVYEYCEGSLASLLEGRQAKDRQSRSLDINDWKWVTVARHLLCGIAALQSRGLADIHIRPQSILICQSSPDKFELKLADYWKSPPSGSPSLLVRAAAILNSALDTLGSRGAEASGAASFVKQLTDEKRSFSASVALQALNSLYSPSMLCRCSVMF